MVYPFDLSCIEACDACVQVCKQCAAAGLAEQDVKAMARCAALAIDCAAVCQVTSAAIAGGGDCVAALCRGCAEVCDECAHECAKHTMQHCRACVQACRRCADECRTTARPASQGPQAASASAAAHV